MVVFNFNCEPLAVTVKQGEEQNIVHTVTSSYRFLYAPVSKGYVCGAVSISGEWDSGSSPLVVKESVMGEEASKSLWQKILDMFKKD